MKLSVVIPCYNEADNLPYLIKKCSGLISKEIEVILVNNGSTDNTIEIFQKYKNHNPNLILHNLNTNIGYGHGIISGLNLARGEVLSWTHADLQTDPNDLIVGLKFFEKNQNSIFVKGNRYGRPFFDVFFTVGMSFFETILLKKFFWDINAQPTMFTKKFFKSWQNPPKDFSLDLYSYYLAKKNNLKILRFPVKFDKRLYGSSKWNFGLNSKLKFIKRTIIYSINLKHNL